MGHQSVGPGPHPMTSVNLNPLPKGALSTYSHPGVSSGLPHGNSGGRNSDRDGREEPDTSITHPETLRPENPRPEARTRDPPGPGPTDRPMGGLGPERAGGAEVTFPQITNRPPVNSNRHVPRRTLHLSAQLAGFAQNPDQYPQPPSDGAGAEARLGAQQGQQLGVASRAPGRPSARARLPPPSLPPLPPPPPFWALHGERP